MTEKHAGAPVGAARVTEQRPRNGRDFGMAGIDGELIQRAQQCVAAAVLDAIPLRAHFGVAQLGSEQGETMPAGEFLPLEVIGVIEAVTPRAFAATVLPLPTRTAPGRPAMTRATWSRRSIKRYRPTGRS